MVRKEGLEKWAPCLGEFCKAREVIISWDGMDRGVVGVERGVP